MAATTKPSKQSNLADLSISSPLFEKRIEFHLARKPFTGFTNRNGAFQLETLNPSTSNSSQFKPNSLAKKVESVEAKENGFDPELSYQISFRRIVSRCELLIVNVLLVRVLVVIECVECDDVFVVFDRVLV